MYRLYTMYSVTDRQTGRQTTLTPIANHITRAVRSAKSYTFITPLFSRR